MSRYYRMMQDAARYEAKRETYAKKVRVLKEVDRTNESPLLAAPSAPLWHVAMTEPRREQAAMGMLRQAGWCVWYPQETVWRELAAKRERVQMNVPLFARYIFVCGSGNKPIGDCRHVTTLLPYRVSRGLIRDLEIRQNGGEFKRVEVAPFETGQRVCADLGWIAALDGIVQHANHERVRILTTLFGALREIEAPVDRVKAA